MKHIVEFLFAEDSVYLRSLANQDYMHALEIIENEAGNYPNSERLVTYNKIMLNALLEHKDETLSTLQASLEKGHFYARVDFEKPQILFTPPIPTSIESLPEFQQLLEAHEQGWQRMLDNAQPRHFTISPDGIDKPPLIIAFHSNVMTPESEKKHYEPLAEMGRLAVLAQSAEPGLIRGSLWGELANTERQVKREWRYILDKYEFAHDDVITAGLATGGGVAMWAAMSGAIPAKAVIALGISGPLVDDLVKLEPYVDAARARGLVFYLAWGQMDSSIPARTLHTAKFLEKQGFRVHLEVMKRVKIGFPPDALNFWKKALVFING